MPCAGLRGACGSAGRGVAAEAGGRRSPSEPHRAGLPTTRIRQRVKGGTRVAGRGPSTPPIGQWDPEAVGAVRIGGAGGPQSGSGISPPGRLADSRP